MEGHTSNLYNEIADQLQCPARALTQEETAARASRIRRKSTKNRPKSVQNRSWKRSWGILGPSSPQDRPKTAKNVQNGVRGPPPDPSWVPKSMQNRPRSLPNAILFCIFFRIAFGHLRGPIFIGSGVRKWSKNRPKIDVQSDLAENAKSLKNLRFS